MPAAAPHVSLPSTPSTLVDVLISQGIIKPDQGEKIKLQEIQTGKIQEEIIKTQGIVNSEELSRAQAQLYNVPFVDLAQVPISPEALAIVPNSVASRFHVIPTSVDLGESEIFLAMANPLDIAAVEFIEQLTKLRVRPLAAVSEQVDQMINERYSVGLAQEVTQAIREAEPEAGDVKTVDLASLDQVIREAPIAKIVKELLAFAIKGRASDIHIEPEEKATRVRYRIDGILHEKFTMPKSFHDSLVSRIKILSGMKIDEKRIPQDGRFNFKSATEEVDLRVSSLPIVHESFEKIWRSSKTSRAGSSWAGFKES